MESVSVANQNVKKTGFSVGVVVPPDGFHKPILYSDKIASRKFNILEKDIYQSVKKSKNKNEKKMPQSVYWFLGLGLLAIAFPFIRKLFK